MNLKAGFVCHSGSEKRLSFSLGGSCERVSVTISCQRVIQPCISSKFACISAAGFIARFMPTLRKASAAPIGSPFVTVASGPEPVITSVIRAWDSVLARASVVISSCQRMGSCDAISAARGSVPVVGVAALLIGPSFALFFALIYSL